MCRWDNQAHQLNIAKINVTICSSGIQKVNRGDLVNAFMEQVVGDYVLRKPQKGRENVIKQMAEMRQKQASHQKQR